MEITGAAVISREYLQVDCICVDPSWMFSLHTLRIAMNIPFDSSNLNL